MLKLRNLFKRRSKTSEKPQNEESQEETTPKSGRTFHPSTKDALGEDRYQASIDETALKDTYESAAEAIAPIPYAVKMAGVKDFTGLIRAIFPFISGITLFALLLYISFNTFDVDKILSSGIDNIILSGLTLLGGIIAIFLNEKFKTISLNDIFKAKARGESIPKGSKRTAFFTVLISIVGSIAGIYFITYEMTDKSEEIESISIAQTQQIESGKSAEIERLISERDLIIAGIKSNIEGWKNKGSNGAKKYRGMIKKENDKLTKVTLEYAGLIKAEKESAAQKTTTATAQTQTDLSENENSSKGRSYLLSVMVLIGEITNIFAWRFFWIYNAKTTKEGMNEAYLHDTPIMTIKEREIRRQAQFIKEYQKTGLTYLIDGEGNNLGLVNQSQPQIIAISKKKKNKKKNNKKKSGVQQIGFKTGQDVKATNPKNEPIDYQKIDTMIRGILQQYDTSQGQSTNSEKNSYLNGNFDAQDAKQSRNLKENKSMKFREAAIELRKQGKTYKQIAELIGRSESQVKRYCKPATN